MEHTTYASRLRYLDADDLDDTVIDFDDLAVQGTDGEKLGELDGFLVEPSEGRVVYAVVDSGGWFSSRRFLLPAEQARLDGGSRVLRVNVSKQSLRGYPEFDEDRFGRYSDDEYQAYHRRLGAAWTTNTMANASTRTESGYRHPDWWPAGGYRVENLRPVESTSFAKRARASSTAAAPLVDPPRSQSRDRDRELVSARERPDTDHEQRHEQGDHDSDDASPHFGGRAQPGDILGLETGGETTGLGDSAEDENKRRRGVEKLPRD